MCKCCQSCLESCYWHCFEKWWCYDDSIALYDDPLAEEKSRRSFDNVAFWDSVAVIANRSVVTIQPLPNKTNENNHQQSILNNNTSTDTEDELKKQTNNAVQNNDQIFNNDQFKSVDVSDSPQKEKVKLRKQSAIEERIEKRAENNPQEKNRKKSLKERRKSAAGLTLKLDDYHEVPVIRQSSMPRFYIETPEVDKLHGNYGNDRGSVLVSPMLGNSPNFSYDLKSIVQIENEIIASQSKPATPKSNRSSRLTHVRKKLKPLVMKKPSSKSLPDSINHM